jgi:hypothetical protein
VVSFDPASNTLWLQNLVQTALSGATIATQADGTVGLVIGCAVNADLGGGTLGPLTSGTCMGTYSRGGMPLWSTQFAGQSSYDTGDVSAALADPLSNAFVLVGAVGSATIDFGTSVLGADTLVDGGPSADAIVAKVVP